MACIHNKIILESDIENITQFLNNHKLSNNYIIIETANGLIILVVYCNNKDWGELCNIL